ncbi:LacI family DNA-binding transcriptional regulator [Tessaracoccus sp. MC1627]|uniref:LacI family DNA-binding transcriptional regulator n=1 Tax=Tessaracoccus sp. MC1627 TaxID=2760312 RepID=UPI0015FFB7BA|nr:LacI family DNA-binding transcriptional regulator [Tessaracoccus sp. MC1627]
MELQLWGACVYVCLDMVRSKRKPPTIVDVARVAGVSLPTVSRVLTGSTPVRDVTRDRVLAAIAELGFRPNGAARALVQGQQSIIGVITPDTSAYGYSRMLLSIEKRARETGYLVAITVVDPGILIDSVKALDVLLGQPIAGVIVLDYSTYGSQRLRESLIGIPVSTVMHGDDEELDVAHVQVDDRRAAVAMTEYLLALGHRTVHHVSVPGRGGRAHIREVAWRQVLTEAGATIPATVPAADWSVASGLAAGAQLALDPDVTAVFCANDELAFGVMRSLHDAGRRVPEDVSVCGIDDVPLAEAVVPSLTTYRLEFDWAGTAAFDLLIDPSGVPAIAGSSSHLIVRESTAAPRGETRAG